MKYFDLVQSFIERSSTVESAGELGDIFRRTVEALGFKYFTCSSHVDPLRPPRLAVVLHSYPAAWIKEYSERQLLHVDPVFQHAEKTLVPFFWDSEDFLSNLKPSQRVMLAEAAEYGIEHGYTIPIHLPNSLADHQASCSIIPDPAITPELASYQAVQLMAYHMYAAASREAIAGQVTAVVTKLSIRERQCLELVAQGKSDWVAGKLLNISERTVHNHIERAKRRLGVSTRVQAIVYALAARQISFGDVIKMESKDRQTVAEQEFRQQ